MVSIRDFREMTPDERVDVTIGITFIAIMFVIMALAA